MTGLQDCVKVVGVGFGYFPVIFQGFFVLMQLPVALGYVQVVPSVTSRLQKLCFLISLKRFFIVTLFLVAESQFLQIFCLGVGTVGQPGYRVRLLRRSSPC